MAVRGRLSIALLMAIVGFVAADFAIVQWLWDSPDPHAAIAVTTLPMINLLLIVLPKTRRSGDSWRSRRAFAAVGLCSVVLTILAGWFAEEEFYSPIIWVRFRGPFPHNSTTETAFLISFAALFYTTPQVLAAMLGGRVARGLWRPRRASSLSGPDR